MLDAAEQVFGGAGFRRASMDEIAHRSGVTKALLFQYFGSKEALYDACMERVRGRLFDSLEEALAGVTAGRERLRIFIETYFEFLFEHRGKPWLLYGETSIGTANAMRELNAEAITRMLREAGDPLRGLRDVDIEVIAHALVGAGEQVGRWWLARPDVDMADAVARFETVAAAITTSLLPPRRS
jgi:AcrR family transcriptional regulator